MTQKNKMPSDDSYIHLITKLLSQSDRAELEKQLDLFDHFQQKTKARILFEISVSDNDDAYFALNHLLCILPKGENQEVLDIFLDKARSNSTYILPFIEHAANTQLKTATPVFASLLLTETDSSFLEKILFAIGETREESCINVVADFIFYDHEGLKREAIAALGKIGGVTSLKHLKFASQTSKKDPFMMEIIDKITKNLSIDTPTSHETVKQFASRQDTLEYLSEDSSISKFINMLDSGSPHERHQAIDGLIDIGPQAIPAVSEQINVNDPDAIINGLDILANIRSEATLPAILKVLDLKHKDSNVRFAAYEAISKQPGTHPSISLIDGITDSVEQVRLAAATAINANLSDTMVAGLRAKIETSGRQSKRHQITTAIIDSHSGVLFSRLMESDAFVFQATEYLSQVHQSTLSFFTDILKKCGRNALASSLLSGSHDSPADSRPLTVYCVDDSEICLKYYTRLFHSMGHNPMVFSQPWEALAVIKYYPPDLVTTDLNMLSMNGLELSEAISQLPSVTNLPVIVVTTQSTFIKDFTDSNLSTITHAIHKPLNSNDIIPFLKIISNASES